MVGASSACVNGAVKPIDGVRMPGMAMQVNCGSLSTLCSEGSHEFPSDDRRPILGKSKLRHACPHSQLALLAHVLRDHSDKVELFTSVHPPAYHPSQAEIDMAKDARYCRGQHAAK